MKDTSYFGKQDPYIKFKYAGEEFQTQVKDDAGTNARWDDETFQLAKISTQVENQAKLMFEAYDKDFMMF